LVWWLRPHIAVRFLSLLIPGDFTMTFTSRAAVAALALSLAAAPAFAATTPAPAPAPTAKKAVHHSAHKVSTTSHKAVKKVKATAPAPEPAAGSPGTGKQ
jgi:hypothetical protein